MKLATIETVLDVKPHPNADRLDIAKVMGWQTVVKRGEFRAGDRGVFVVIDTILPRAPWSEFLVDAKNPEKPIRLRTVKLRGEYSQGLLLPVSVLPDGVRDWQDGVDVGGELGIRKYEKEIPLALSGQVRGQFPQHLAAKTDEENGLSNLDIVEYVLRHPVYVTQKLDGSSGTVIIEDGKIAHVCSRNLSLEDAPGNAFWHAAKKMQGVNLLPNLTAQGELMGPGIQGNQLGLKEPTLFLFSVILRGSATPLTYEGMQAFARDTGLEIVPLVGHFPLGVLQSAAECQMLADRQVLPNGKPAEGIVVRVDPPHLFGNGRPAGFKIINRNYKDTD